MILNGSQIVVDKVCLYVLVKAYVGHEEMQPAWEALNMTSNLWRGHNPLDPVSLYNSRYLFHI